jgi:hypothetical protein
MSELTFEEKANSAALRAREKEADKHFYDAAQPFFPLGFSICYRNPGHWDIFADQVPGKDAAWLTAHGPGSSINGATVEDIDRLRLKHRRERERAFCIRGEPGKVYVRDERWDPHRPHPREGMKFRSVLAAVLWIAEELMQEPHQITGEGS